MLKPSREILEALNDTPSSKGAPLTVNEFEMLVYLAEEQVSRLSQLEGELVFGLLWKIYTQGEHKKVAHAHKAKIKALYMRKRAAHCCYNTGIQYGLFSSNS